MPARRLGIVPGVPRLDPLVVYLALVAVIAPEFERNGQIW